MSDTTVVTQEEIKELKAKVNKSIEQLVRMVLQVKKRVDQLDERIAIFNARAGHKL